MRLLSEHVLRTGTVRTSSAQTSSAFDCLPPEMKRAVLFLTEGERRRIEEIRLRTGRFLTVTIAGREQILTRDGKLIADDTLGRGILCPAEYVRYAVEKAANGFVYSAEETIRQGFITLRGGHRCGLCGHAVVSGDAVTAINSFSSVCIRIARDIEGIAAEGTDAITAGGAAYSTLIISPPLAGKTTYLRDLVRNLCAKGLRVGICDERSEIAALSAGEPQFAIGHSVDVIDSCPKAQAAMLLLRSMAPQIIAMDEITAPGDIAAILCAANCGVAVVATAHAENIDELLCRRIYAPLWENRVFSRVIELSVRGGERRCAIYDASV